MMHLSYFLCLTQTAFDRPKAAAEFQYTGMSPGQVKAVARPIRQRNEDLVTNCLYVAVGIFFTALVAVRFLV